MSTGLYLLVWVSIVEFLLFWAWYSDKKKDWEAMSAAVLSDRDQLKKIQLLLLGNVCLNVSAELVGKEEWEDVVIILSFSEYLNEVNRVPFETTVEKWVGRLSKELSDIKAGSASWIWGNWVGQPHPKAACPLKRVGDVSLFFPYFTQLVTELSSLDPEKSKLTDVTLAKITEHEGLLSQFYVQHSLSSR